MAVVRIARELSEEKGQSCFDGVTAEKLYEAAKAGDAIAIEAFRRLGYYLGIVLAGLINVVDPDMIVLAGGLSGGWDVFIDETSGQIAKRAFRLPALRAKLVRAELGDDAGILGVARLALEIPDQGLLER
jgi:glucokinase